MAPFGSLGTISYSPTIVIMALSCIISEIKRDIGQKIAIFSSPPFTFDAAVRSRVSRWEYCHIVWHGRTDGQTDIVRWRIVRAMHSNAR